MTLTPITGITYFVDSEQDEVFIARGEPPHAKINCRKPRLEIAVKLINTIIANPDFDLIPTVWGWYAVRYEHKPCYTKLQVIEAGQKLYKLLESERVGKNHLEYARCIVDDLIGILAGALNVAVSDEVILTPEHGFVPVIGEVGAGGEVTWYGGDE